MAYERKGDAAGRTLVDDERAVRVARPRRAERVEQQRLGQRVRRVLRRADDVRDAVARVVGGLRVVMFRGVERARGRGDSAGA